MIRLTDFFVLKYPDGSMVGVDPGSGGYPFAAFSPATIRFWRRDEAEKYLKIFNKEGLTLHKIVEFSTKKVELI